MKRTEPMTIRQIIDKVMDNSARRDDILEMRAASLWPDVVGSGVNSYTTRRSVKEGVLHVYLSSGPLKSELSFRREAIITAINNILGKEIVKSIQFH
jgi:predicted nucleic acid-binding Zn ribbon protein